MKHDSTIDMNQLNKETFQSIYKDSADVFVFSKYYSTNSVSSPYYMKPPVEVYFLLSEVFVDNFNYKETILPNLTKVYDQTGFTSIQQMDVSPLLGWVVVGSTEQEITVRKLSNLIFGGNVICVFPSLKAIFSINCAKIPIRTPAESSSEISIRGAKDGLVENIETNIALIRKRIRNEQLTIETFLIGDMTNTKLVLLYMNNIANENTIALIKERIASINVEQVVTTGQLEELVADSTYLFPTVAYSSRPDYIVQNLLNGRFALLLDNNPMSILAPGNFFHLLVSPEDSYFPLFASNVGRLFRVTALIISIFLPSFYIAMTTFHPDQIPFTMLATISIARFGIPMEAGIEMFLIMSFMELFREASIRMPSNMAQTITVVGGLIMGEAAIRAGLVSPILVVVAAISIITGATLVNQSLTSSVVLFRLLAFLLGAMLGIYGVISAYILFILLLSRLHSFGVPYLAPLSPLSLKNLLIGIFQVPLRFRKGRPSYLHTQKTKKDE